MTMDLWGEIPEPGKERTPFAILQEQASLLQEKTGLLLGRVRRVREDSEHLCHMLEIVAPKLDNYAFGVVAISYDIDMLYPVRVESLVRHEKDDWGKFVCDSEKMRKLFGRVAEKCSSQNLSRHQL